VCIVSKDIAALVVDLQGKQSASNFGQVHFEPDSRPKGCCTPIQHGENTCVSAEHLGQDRRVGHVRNAVLGEEEIATGRFGFEEARREDDCRCSR
jgi:hypothetical protein